MLRKLKTFRIKRRCLFVLPVRFTWNNFVGAVVILVMFLCFCIIFESIKTAVNSPRKLKNTSYPGVRQYVNYSVVHFGLQPLTDVKPLNPDFGDVINDVTSFKYPITIPPCQGVPTNRSIFIAVISAPSYFDKRDLIRETWMKTFQSMHDKGLLQIEGFGFIMGLTSNYSIQREIEKESRIYGDIIQIEMIDTYRNLSTKVVGLLNWVNEYCSSNIDFVLKVDDDVFVNARNVLHFFNENFRQPNYNIYTTIMFKNARPHRRGKWEISYEKWPWRSYPTFAPGGSVLMPKDIIFPLLAASQTIPMIPLEDVYLIGLCVEKAEIVIQSSRSILAIDFPLIPDACQIRTSITWLTNSNKHMNNSQLATEDIYSNHIQCFTTNEKTVTSTIIDFEAPVQFNFDTKIEESSKSKKRKISFKFG